MTEPGSHCPHCSSVQPLPWGLKPLRSLSRFSLILLFFACHGLLSAQDASKAGRTALPSPEIGFLRSIQAAYPQRENFEWILRSETRTGSKILTAQRLCRRNGSCLESLEYEPLTGNQSIRTHFLWDGQLLYQRETAPNLLLVSQTPSGRIDFPSHFGDVLDGALGNGAAIHEILLRYRKNVRIATDPDTIAGFPCIQAEASTPLGDIRAWIDPRAANRYRQYEISIGPGQRYQGALLGEGPNRLLREVWLTCGPIQLHQQASGSFVATNGILRRRFLWADGSRTSETVHLTRSRIRISSNFAGSSAFRLHIPNDTPVLVADLGLQMQWQDETFVHALSAAQVGKIARDLESILRGRPRLLNEPTSETRSIQPEAPYGGLLCLAMAANRYRHRIGGDALPLETFLCKEYLPWYGARIFDSLSSAAAQASLHAIPVQNLSRKMMADAPAGTILSVRPSDYDPEFTHHILYIGAHGKLAEIYDPNRGHGLVPWNNLFSHMNGVGLLLSPEPIAPLGRASKAPLFLALLAAAFAVLTTMPLLAGRQPANLQPHGNAGSIPYVKEVLIQMAILLCIAGAVAAFRHTLFTDGLLRSAETVRRLQRQTAAKALPKINRSEAQKLAASGEALFLDCRYRSAYREAHIPGALHTPPYMPVPELEKALKGISKNQMLALYCSNRDCAYSELTARRLLELGYRNILDFEGGWQEWQSR